MKIGILFSGGKDSVFALYSAIQEGHEVKCLISMIPLNQDSYMFHKPDLEILKKQAQALEIPLVLGKTKGKKELELKDLKNTIEKSMKKYEIQGIFSGALASNYQFERVNSICKELSLKSLAPSWQKDMYDYIKNLINLNFEIIITQIAADGLNEKWLSRRIDNNCLEDLKKLNKELGVSIAGEGGEYETLVLNGIIFKKKLVVLESAKEMESEHQGKLVIKKIELEDK